MINLKALLPKIPENYDGENIDKLKKLIVNIIKEELTKKQREYFYLYVFENRKISEIALLKGVTKSCVSNNIKRSKLKIRRLIKLFFTAFE